jgi:hypothetical protein
MNAVDFLDRTCSITRVMLTDAQRHAVAAASWAMVTYDQYAVARCGEEYLAGEGNAETLAEFLWPESVCPHEQWDECLRDPMPIVRLQSADIGIWYPKLKSALSGRLMVIQDVLAFRMEHPPEYFDHKNPWFHDWKSDGYGRFDDPTQNLARHSVVTTSTGLPPFYVPVVMRVGSLSRNGSSC